MMRRKERLQRKRSILRSALDVFSSKGFNGSTVDEIAHGSGLAKGTIYLYFKSKEDIYVSVISEGMGLLKKEMEKAVQEDIPSDRLLERLVGVYHGFYKKRKAHFRIMFLGSQPDMRFCSAVSEEVFAGSMETAKGCLGIVSGVIDRGIEEGLFRDIPSWAAANILWAMVNGIIAAYEQDPAYRDEIAGMGLEDVLHESLDLVFKGLRVRG